MSSLSINPAVVVLTVIALFITGLSIYISRIFLPMKIKQAYRKSMAALIAAVETKEAGTVGHAQRVASLTVEVARRVGIAARDLDKIEYASLLMDIGKANVPQSILMKSGPLTQSEWETIKQHPVIGAEMVRAVPFLADTADYILHHHEYWDGSGYNNGLVGEKIPLVSRILCVTADYDAMVSSRPYHPRPLTKEEALDEIIKGSGTRYDPAVAQVFLDMMWTESVEEDAEACASDDETV